MTKKEKKMPGPKALSLILFKLGAETVAKAITFMVRSVFLYNGLSR